VVEVPDAQVGTQLPEHLRDQLELVVVDPHGRALCGLVRGRLREAPVHLLVRVPPLAVERRGLDDVVVERPEGVVGEALVELLQVVLGQHDRDQLGAVHVERLELEVG
jgi:hypothetical protein